MLHHQRASPKGITKVGAVSRNEKTGLSAYWCGKPNAQTYHVGIILTTKMAISRIVYGSACQIARSANLATKKYLRPLKGKSSTNGSCFNDLTGNLYISWEKRWFLDFETNPLIHWSIPRPTRITMGQAIGPWWPSWTLGSSPSCAPAVIGGSPALLALLKGEKSWFPCNALKPIANHPFRNGFYHLFYGDLGL